MISLEAIREAFLWCSIINIGLLMFWFGLIAFAHDWVYRVHTKWFNMSVEKFDSVHYSGMGLFKLVIGTFNVVPYLALSIVG
jgi:hypothetical protein